MFCIKCGAQLAEGDLFCKKCGNAVANPINSAPTSDNPVQTPSNPNNPTQKACKNIIKIIIPITAVVLAVIIAFTAFGGKRIHEYGFDTPEDLIYNWLEASYNTPTDFDFIDFENELRYFPEEFVTHFYPSEESKKEEFQEHLDDYKNPYKIYKLKYHEIIYDEELSYDEVEDINDDISSTYHYKITAAKKYHIYLSYTVVKDGYSYDETKDRTLTLTKKDGRWYLYEMDGIGFYL